MIKTRFGTLRYPSKSRSLSVQAFTQLVPGNEDCFEGFTANGKIYVDHPGVFWDGRNEHLEVTLSLDDAAGHVPAFGHIRPGGVLDYGEDTEDINPEDLLDVPSDLLMRLSTIWENLELDGVAGSEKGDTLNSLLIGSTSPGQLGITLMIRGWSKEEVPFSPDEILAIIAAHLA